MTQRKLKQFDLFTDNWAVTFIETPPTLSSKQARWLNGIQEFKFHIKGNLNRVADALSQSSEMINAISTVMNYRIGLKNIMKMMNIGSQ